jgi:pimeloyl-ACP methyl ester carboxylesterase
VSGELHAYALAGDGTRLFVRAQDGGGKQAFDPNAVHAVLCDGIACDGFIWKYLWSDLARVVPVVHWHYRGHGRSAQPRNPDNVDVPAHADDLASVRKYMGDPPSVLFGHSMGVQVVLEEMRLHSKGVRALVLMCGSFGKVTHTFKGGPILEMLLPKLVAAVKNNEGLARAIWGRITPELALKVALRAGDLDPERIHPEDFAPYIQHVRSMDFPMFLRMLSAAGEHSAEDLLQDIKVPTLIVAGEKDTFTPSYLADWMAEKIPGAELFMVRPGTHVAALEQPELVRDRITEFLRAKVL